MSDCSEFWGVCRVWGLGFRVEKLVVGFPNLC